MDLNTKLRRLTPGQIIAAAAFALLIGMLALILGVSPLVTVLLLPFGEATAAIAGLLVTFGGALLLGNRVGTIFGKAYYDRKFDDELHKATVIYQESREQHG